MRSSFRPDSAQRSFDRHAASLSSHSSTTSSSSDGTSRYSRRLNVTPPSSVTCSIEVRTSAHSHGQGHDHHIKSAVAAISHCQEPHVGQRRWPSARAAHSANVQNPARDARPAYSATLPLSSTISSRSTANDNGVVHQPDPVVASIDFAQLSLSDREYMHVTPPPAYRRTPPPMSYEMVEDLHERTVARPGAHHCPTNTTSTSSETSDVSRVQPKRLRITIPDTPPATPRTSSSPITTLWYPPSHDTDVCPAPGSAQIHALDNDQFVYRHKQACHSLDSHARTPMPAARSPCTPPPLIRQEYIPLPPVESPTLVSTPHSWTTNASSTQAKTRRFSVDSAVTSLPHIQEPDNELLSPLQLMDPLGHCPMDLVGPLDRCLMMVEQVQAVLPTSDEVQALWVSLSSAFTGIKKEAIRPLPSSHLAAVDDAKWQEIHDEVVASCARNLDRFLQVAGSVGRRPLDSHRISKVLYVFGWYALKFEDIERRFKIYSNHIHTLELRAELQSLNEIARAEADAERQNRHAAKVAAQRTKERREELKARILREEEAARVRR